jgi:hypothetical protein
MGDAITGYPDHYIINGDTTSCPCLEHSPKSARSELEFQAALSVGSPEYDVWFGLLLDRYRAEVLREAAERIRAANFGDPYYTGTGQHDAANLIDPEVS